MTTPDWAPGLNSAPVLFEEYARLRATCPVAFTEEYGGFWTLSRYSDVRQAAADVTTFRSGRPFLMDSSGDQFIPESLNPPEHTGYRRLLKPHFRPARMAALEPTVRAYAAEHLRGLIDNGGGDFVAEVAHSMPTRVLCAFLNLPDDLWPTLKALNRERTVATGDDGRVRTATARFLDLIAELVDDRRRAPRDPDHDLISALTQGDIDGVPLREDEIAQICYQVFLAGADTTSATLGCAAVLLATHQEQQARLRADPRLIRLAVEEVLRLEPALHYMGRIVAGGACLHGRALPDGDAVALNFAAANRDAERFPDPDAFDVTRRPNPHLTFGHGIHKCLGAPLARLEVSVVIQELLRRTEVFELAGAPQRGSSFPSTYRSVPVRTAA